jgi:hypothetical protein
MMKRRTFVSLSLLLPFLGACESGPTAPAGEAGVPAGLDASGSLLMSASVLGAEPVVWEGNGHAYEAIDVPDGITWVDADVAASSGSLEGCQGYLATITSTEETAFIVGNLPEAFPPGARGFWIGGFQEPGSDEPAGGWAWVTGEEFSYTNWNGGEPNDWRLDFPDLGEDAIHLADDGAGLWNDLPSLDVTPGYLVEYDAGCAAQILEIPVGVWNGRRNTPRPVNLRSRGVITVIAFSTSVADGEPADFAAAAIDPETVTLGDGVGTDTPVASLRNGRLKMRTRDVDGDGDMDMVFQFRTRELVENGDLGAETTELILMGETTEGQAFHGPAEVRIVP